MWWLMRWVPTRSSADLTAASCVRICFAVLALLDHALQTADLALDARQPVEDAARRLRSWPRFWRPPPASGSTSGSSVAAAAFCHFRSYLTGVPCTTRQMRRATMGRMERSTGFEPATSSLGSWHSTN